MQARGSLCRTGEALSQVRNGSGILVQQFIHGTQYIDELVMVRVKDKGEFYYHQDANWNVIARWQPSSANARATIGKNCLRFCSA